MTSNEFRKMALQLPEAVESSHMGHPDFRVGGKIFATLGYPDSGVGMVKLMPDEQELFVQMEPDGFQPVKGGWGRQGATNVGLRSAKKSTVREALLAAWRIRAPKSLAEKPAEPKSPKGKPVRRR
ncbi:MAG TPA: MmcQ/YjbR family DNA-binding protein [Thermoanaerobaculia bacterium]|nr:MmcQ/YjbR family DNA-binding protein [Thermoanaerobaculia bacterium]